MTVPITLVNSASGGDTFQILISRLNQSINAISNNMVTVDGSANGSLSTGNGYVNGVFSALSFATGTLRGGNVQATAVLTIASNVSVGNSTANVVLTYGTAAITNAMTIGANLSVNTSIFKLGNTTVNAVINSSMLTLNGVNVVTTSLRTKVANGGVVIGTRDIINFVPGTNISLAVTDDSGGGQVNVVITSTAEAGASVAGSNTQVQFNDSLALGASAGFTFNKAANNLAVSNTLYAAIHSYDSGNVSVQHITLTSTGTSAQLFDSWAMATYRSAAYTLSIKNNSANGYSSEEIRLLHDDGDAYSTEFAQMNSNGVLGTWTANVSGGNVRLYVTPTAANTTIRSLRTLLAI